MLVINNGRKLFDGTPTEIFKEHGPELVKIGVDVPQVYKLADLLRSKGLRLPEGIKDDVALVKGHQSDKGVEMMLTDITLGQYFPGNSLHPSFRPAYQDFSNFIIYYCYFLCLQSAVLWYF